MVRRNTVQRSMVLDAVMRLRSHPTADEVYAEVSRACPAISRATVYRNLGQLCEQGEISRREIPGGADRYDHLTTDHYHICCTLCGRVADVGMDYLSELSASVRDTHGYAITGHSIIFRGLCPACRSSEDRP